MAGRGIDLTGVRRSPYGALGDQAIHEQHSVLVSSQWRDAPFKLSHREEIFKSQRPEGQPLIIS